MINFFYSKRNLAIKYAFCFIGQWYKWGGNVPGAFDCSGLMCEILKSVGLIGRNEDLTAASLYERFKNKKVEKPYKGCLVFWYSNDSNKIIHIEMCIDKEHSIGASGGGSNTLTVEDAIKQSAFIKVRRWDSRSNVFGFVDPFL